MKKYRHIKHTFYSVFFYWELLFFVFFALLKARKPLFVYFIQAVLRPFRCVDFRPLSGAVRFSVIALDGFVQTGMDLVSGFSFLDSIRIDVRVNRVCTHFLLLEVANDGRGTCTLRPYTIESDAFVAFVTTSVPRRPTSYRLLVVKPSEKVSVRVRRRLVPFCHAFLRSVKWNGSGKNMPFNPTQPCGSHKISTYIR